MNAEQRIENAVDKGLEKVDLYEIALEDVLHRRNISAFFRAALKSYLQSIVAEVGQQQ